MGSGWNRERWHRPRPWEVVTEISIGPLVLPTGMGSFDFVRLAPHFAQDDRVEKKLDLWRGGQVRAIAISEADTSHCGHRHRSVSLVLSS